MNLASQIVGFTFYNHHKFSPRALPLADPWPAFWQLIETVHYSAYMYLYEFIVLSALPNDLLECLRVFIRIPAWKKALRKKSPGPKTKD